MRPALLALSALALAQLSGAQAGGEPSGAEPSGAEERAQDPAQQGSEDRALIEGVQAIFAAKCAPCHAPGSSDEKALRDWGCADDLAATLALEDLVVPGAPDDSDLYLSVEFGDMPPGDWEGGTACTPAELEALHAWIAAGAPVPEDTAAPDEGASGESQAAQAAPTPARARSPWRSWLGRLHPAVVHFPIALLLVAVLAHLLRRRDVASFLLVLGALSAVFASVLGWIAGETTPTTKLEDLDRHRWTGVAASAWALAAMALYPRWTRDPSAPRLRVGVLLVGLVVLISLAGHWGGEFHWGHGYLTPPW